MSNTFKSFRKIYHRFDEDSAAIKSTCLKKLLNEPLPPINQLSSYMDILLFTSAYPQSKTISVLANKLLNRLGKELKANKYKGKLPLNSGLPYAMVRTKFSHEQLTQLLNDTAVKVSPDGFEEPLLSLNQVLRLTMPSAEREITSAGMSNDELLEYLDINPSNQIPFLLDQLNHFKSSPLTLDLLFDGLTQYVKVLPTHAQYSRAFNKINVDEKYISSQLVKKFDHKELLSRALPKPINLSDEQKSNWIKVIKRTLVLTARETDPVTYLQPSSLRVYQLESGISIALYGIIPERQLPFESYIGFTLFRNGLPVSYGGGWLFGKRILFGMNVFEPYRGGESGLIMCQLLRTYLQVSGASYIEIEPYQYGLDNPEGITSGAFWFYYKYGFRPVDKTLGTLADAEMERMKKNPSYRSSEKTLLRFTESNIALNFAKEIPMSVGELSMHISDMITKKFQGIRSEAAIKSMEQIVLEYDLEINSLSKNELSVLEDYALWNTLKNKPSFTKENLLSLIKYKGSDWLAYQQLLVSLF